MAIKFEKITPGTSLWEVVTGKMGNTTISTVYVYEVKIISVCPETRTAVVSWNHNNPETWGHHRLCSLRAKKPETTRGSLGQCILVRRKHKSKYE